jgi:hypothetical protein
MLFLGRRLFWVFVGSIGFITATEFAMANFAEQPEWAIVLIGLAFGVLGALLAVFFQAGAIALAGILGGGYLGLLVIRSLNVSSQTALTIAYIIGAVAGLILFYIFFDSALIAISSFIGATILVQQFSLTDLSFWLLLVLIAFVGIVVQVQQKNRLVSE